MDKITLLWKKYHLNSHSINFEDIDLWMLADLGVTDILKTIEGNSEYRLTEENVCQLMCVTKDDIIFRQRVLMDFLDNPQLPELFFYFLRSIEKIKYYMREYSLRDQTKLVAYHSLYLCIKEYVSVLKIARQELTTVKSEGLNRLKDYLDDVWSEQNLDDIQEKLSKIQGYWNPPKSIGFGLNVDLNYNVRDLTVTDICDRQNDNIFGLTSKTNISKETTITFTNKSSVRRGKDSAKLQYYIYRKLSSLLGTNLTRLQRDLRSADPGVCEALLYLFEDFKFYCNSWKWFCLLEKKGIQYCFANAEDKGINYLELQNPISCIWENDNTVFQSKETVCEPINIVTGSTETGKLKYIQAVGANQVLFQLGFVVCAKEAHAQIFKKIGTLFAQGENSEDSRFGRDAYITSKIQSLSDTLILLNEPYVSTNPQEGEDIAFSVLLTLYKNDSYCFCATHFSELFNRLSNEGVLIDSIVISKKTNCFYNLIYGTPFNKSYAMQLAEKCNFTLEHMLSSSIENTSKYIFIKELQKRFRSGE